MKLRGKLLILLLVIALVPLLLSALLHQVTMRRLGTNLTTDARKVLEERAYQFLQGRVNDFGVALRRNQETLRLALEFQAREIEWRLAAEKPRSIPGFHREQAIILIRDADPQAAAGDVARLSSLPETYRRIQHILPSLLYRQHTALESGVYSSYPWQANYPFDQDPRKQPWYFQARAREGLSREVVADAMTGKPLLTISLPVHHPDGSFAGVTAIDVAYDSLFADWRRPERWAGQAESLVVTLHRTEDHQAGIEILLRESLPGTDEDWKIPPTREFLDSASREELAALQSDVRAGRAGIRKMDWHGRAALMAYSPGMAGEPFPLVIVPVELLLAPVEQAEAYFGEQIRKGLALYAYLLLAVVVWVVVTAFFRAGSVTRPVASLAEAADRLAKEDFKTKVDIRTGDELQALGETFNRMGDQLKERLEMKRSLSLAREIQQMLLPLGPPRLPGFEIAGQTLYCDETGGDYFDFIDLGPGRLGLAVGDVTGHGVGAALLMATARGVLRSQAARSGLTMAQLFGDLNRHLAENTADTLFMTLFYGIIDSENRTFHWISAGHGPVFQFSRQSGQFVELPSTGIPLGIMAEAAFEAGGSRVLQRGDILLVGTDGVWETEGPAGELFGIARLQQAVAGAAGGTAEEILVAVMAAVANFRGEPSPKDDLTLIVVKC
ncbi:MAG TPA: SpoIIE family protein phosphatase [Desulfuromonadales bacterium]|nr:SpoIIE family protein phosphatase [Desulfuromonadales bacterium]